ncbi:MAG: hypothetical protein JW716_04045 [Candidatus Aenigmarchaeota archaeon]|nr:hypothetical protein [Candidatus Aenigmarchaeota archaeon]
MNRIVFILLGVVMIALVFVAGCVESESAGNKAYSRDEALAACQELCKNSKAAGLDLSDGPCLSNQVVRDWVCDIAHNPRQNVDNVAENQCQSFLKQEAHHFIELDENCNFIQSY